MVYGSFDWLHSEATFEILKRVFAGENTQNLLRMKGKKKLTHAAVAEKLRLLTQKGFIDCDYSTRPQKYTINFENIREFLLKENESEQGVMKAVLNTNVEFAFRDKVLFEQIFRKSIKQKEIKNLYEFFMLLTIEHFKQKATGN